ncbi:MAG: tRNA 2-thiocytidine biosynthesis TtcA family protein [Blautia sp.]|nr:tRNA 2-thiocytidine biosynthesis TtcA family protein [Blautia sp.]
MKLQQVLSITRKAIDDFHMIESGDKIAVGISGGKDSLTLLYALKHLSRFYPNPFSLEAITVDLGIEGVSMDPLRQLCDELDVHYTSVPTEIYDIIFEKRKETNPCSLCAKMRKGALNTMAKELGCNKVAYAHHKDDVIETMLMSLIYEGRFHTFSPVTYWDRTDITLIRPMIYMNEMDVIGFQHKYDLPVVRNRCPADGNTKREYIKNLIRQLNEENPGVKERMFAAVLSGNLKGWEKAVTQKHI